MLFCSPRRYRVLAALLMGAFLTGLSTSGGAAEHTLKKAFDVPVGPAAESLKKFISQSAVQLLFVADEVSGVKTNAIKGEFTPGDAIRRLLANTGLKAVETPNGAIAVNRAHDPNGERVAQKKQSDHPKIPAEVMLVPNLPAL